MFSRQTLFFGGNDVEGDDSCGEEEEPAEQEEEEEDVADHRSKGFCCDGKDRKNIHIMKGEGRRWLGNCPDSNERR